MKRNKIFLTAITLVLFFEVAVSQVNQVTYFMKMPQNHFLNPAIRPSDKIYIGLPVLTGLNFSFGNNFIELTDIFTPNLKADSIISFQNPNFDLAKFASKMKDNNTITADAGIQLLGFGFMVGKDLNIFFDIADRFAFKTVFPKELMKLFIAGPDQFVNQTFNLPGLNIKGQYYREYGLGFSKDIATGLRIGAKVKLLSGITTFSFDNRNFSLKINNDLSQTVTADASMNVSGKEALNQIFTQNNFLSHTTPSAKTNLKGFLMDYLKPPVSNSGFGFDIGAVYNLGKMFTFSASVTDLGFITWKKDLKSYIANSTFNLPGITIEDVVNKTISIDNMMKALIDTIKSNFIEDPTPATFKTYLPTSITAGASINLLKFISLGVLSNTRVYAGQVKEAVTLSGNIYAGRTLSASLSYTMANYSYNNFGFGLAFKTGAVAQIYFIADKIPLSWEKVYFKKSNGSGYAGIPMPSNWNMLNLQMGLNIVFGKPVSKVADKPMLLEAK